MEQYTQMIFTTNRSVINKRNSSMPFFLLFIIINVIMENKIAIDPLVATHTSSVNLLYQQFTVYIEPIVFIPLYLFRTRTTFVTGNGVVIWNDFFMFFANSPPT